jgi:hypothetical protein
MTAVMMGIDPRKGSHTAVAIDAGEVPLGRVRICDCPDQAVRLLAWARAWPDRTWPAGGATGLEHLLAQQLVAAGERVWDIQPKLAEFNADLQVARAMTARRSSRRRAIRRTPRHKEAPHEGRARPAGVGEAADGGHPCHQPSLNGDSCGEDSRRS